MEGDLVDEIAVIPVSRKSQEAKCTLLPISSSRQGRAAKSYSSVPSWRSPLMGTDDERLGVDLGFRLAITHTTSSSSHPSCPKVEEFDPNHHCPRALAGVYCGSAEPC